jgi:hypothetical protein
MSAFRFAAAIVLAAAAAIATHAAGPAAPRVFTGIITDSMCNLDHKHMGATDEAKCVLDCVRTGRYKFVLHDGRQAYKLSDQETPAKFAAKRVRVTGTLFEKTGVIKVDRIELAR